MKFNTLLLIGTILLAGTNTVSAKKSKTKSVPAATPSVASAKPTAAPTGGLSNMIQGAKGFVKQEGANIVKNVVDNLSSKVHPSASGVTPVTAPTPIADVATTTQQPSILPNTGRVIKRSIAKLLKFLA